MRKKPSKNAKKSKTKTLEEILDSDDELPTEYIDLPFVPAYQMDNRFEHIEKENAEGTAIDPKKEGLSTDASVVVRGHLNKKDTFCYQCLELNTSKETQQWFFNFLMIKDLNASYTFLSTCLVPSYEDGYSCADIKFFKGYTDIISRYNMIAVK